MASHPCGDPVLSHPCGDSVLSHPCGDSAWHHPRGDSILHHPCGDSVDERRHGSQRSVSSVDTGLAEGKRPELGRKKWHGSDEAPDAGRVL